MAKTKWTSPPSVLAARLTELEGAVLGLIEQNAPCTASTRQLFQKSPTSSWRASTGSIYPLINKLVRLKLVDGERSCADRRGTRRLALTAGGRKALAGWVMQTPDWLADVTSDPILYASVVRQ